MNAGILFHFANRTALCQRAIENFWDSLQCQTAQVKLAPREKDLFPVLSSLLRSCSIVAIVSDCGEDGRPLCARTIFETLRVPLTKEGEPRGVLALSGVTKKGYLVESENQAILLLADVPYEINPMLQGARQRLQAKFELEWQEPPQPVLDFEARMEP